MPHDTHAQGFTCLTHILHSLTPLTPKEVTPDLHCHKCLRKQSLSCHYELNPRSQRSGSYIPEQIKSNFIKGSKSTELNNPFSLVSMSHHQLLPRDRWLLLTPIASQ